MEFKVGDKVLIDESKINKESRQANISGKAWWNELIGKEMTIEFIRNDICKMKENDFLWFLKWLVKTDFFDEDEFEI